MEQQLNDDSSHYEISLTAGQAFVSFVLLLLSLAASFAFGIMVGRGQGPGGLASRQEPAPVITEKGATVDVPETTTVAQQPAAPAPALAAGGAGNRRIVSKEDMASLEDWPAEPFVIEPAPRETPAPAPPPSTAPVPSTEPVPHFAQLLSTGDQRTAEALAARLIDEGFTSAYVERTPGESGMIHRVRVRFPSEAEARAAVPRLQGYTSESIWVTRQQ